MGRRPTLRGFTLVELLVVITIIGILIALLMPAVQQARDSARATQCRNSLKQLGLAVLQYESKRGILPPASQWFTAGDMNTQNNSRFGPSWIVAILPYIDQENVYNKFDFTKSISDVANREPRGVVLPIVMCPNDSTYNRVKYGGKSGSAHTSNHGDNWARNNYGANVGPGYHSTSAHCESTPLPSGCAGNSEAWKNKALRGVLGPNLSTTVAAIRDGTSNTILLLEIRAGVTTYDCRGVWAMGGAGPSAVAACGYKGDDRGPNSRQIWADDIPDCGDIQTAVGGEAALQLMGMPCYPGTGGAPNRQASPRSQHPGGIFCCLCDGSVRFIGDNIETAGTAVDGTTGLLTSCSLWDRLLLSQDNFPVSGDRF